MQAETCSFCGKAPALIFTKAREYGLCAQCAYLFYPQIDTQAAIQNETAIEDAVRTAHSAAELCKGCGIRGVQVYSEEGDLCLICAKKRNMPRADKIAARMGVSAERFETFLQAVQQAEPAPETEPAQQSQNGDARFTVVERCAVGSGEIVVVADRTTGVQYLTNQDLSGFSPVIGQDGKPLLYNVTE